MLISRLFSRVVLFTLGALLLVQPAYADSIQNFDTDPHWTRFNNPANGFPLSCCTAGFRHAWPASKGWATPTSFR